ncbi:MAG TPA: M48 family peptidase [Desulfobulbaceae bacterium]|nr:M48 family peptidase [Desulfobulbaceae bacterium]
MLGFTVSLLSLRALDPVLPGEFDGIYDGREYARSQEYTRVTTRFSMLQSTLMLPLTIFFILLGGFNILDGWARSFGFSSIFTGLVFTGLLLLLSGLVQLPFTLYSTFVIENRFGLNRTTIKTFVLDILKTLLLTVLLGGPVLALILWFFEWGGSLAWLYCWFLVITLTVIMQFVAPVIILPLFNRFVPLEDGPLRQAITNYAGRQNFPLQGIYTMDGSKRSNKLNAFFTGFGRYRRIVFFDTLLDKMNVDELVAILAHEMGHFKKKHILKMMVATILQTGLMFALLSLFIRNSGLFAAFGMEHLSIYAGLVFFGFLYSPISTVLSIVGNRFSRQYEYEADGYAVATTGLGPELIMGLKKLCRANMSNLTPHPLQVLLQYSHPPVLQRIEAIKTIKTGT